jgi:hypothetical protein
VTLRPAGVGSSAPVPSGQTHVVAIELVLQLAYDVAEAKAPYGPAWSTPGRGQEPPWYELQHPEKVSRRALSCGCERATGPWL